MLTPEDRFSKYKLFEVNLWRGYKPEVTGEAPVPEQSLFNDLSMFVPLPGKLVGIRVEFAVQQKATG